MQRTIVLSLILLMTASDNSSVASAAEWVHGETDQVFERDTLPETPLLAVWRLLQSAAEDDQDAFRKLFGQVTDEVVKPHFELWRRRLREGLPIKIILAGRRGQNVAYIGLFSWHKHQVFPPEKSPETFVGIVFLERLEGKWQIDPHGWEKRQEEGFPLRRVMDQISRAQRSLQLQAERDALRRYNERGQEMLLKSSDHPEEDRKKDEIAESMLANGVDIPDTFNEMFDLYTATVYTPPKVFDARTVQEHTNVKEWKDILRHTLHKRWQNGKLATHVGTLGTVKKELKTDAQVLAVVTQKVGPKTIKFVYCNVLDGDSQIDDQWITTTMVILAREEDGPWREDAAWYGFPGIVCRQYVRISGDVVYRIRTSDRPSFPGITLRPTVRRSGDAMKLEYRIGAIEAQKGSTLSQILDAANWPSPFDRIYTVDECRPF